MDITNLSSLSLHDLDRLSWVLNRTWLRLDDDRFLPGGERLDARFHAIDRAVCRVDDAADECIRADIAGMRRT